MLTSSEISTFNLIDEPWLPARRRSGVVEYIRPSSITDGIGEDPFVAFAWPRPDFNGAVHEFLIGLLSTITAPADDDEWDNWWYEPPTVEVLEQRFSVLADAFNLDGLGLRFLQDVDSLEDSKEKEIATLLIDMPGAQTLRNNADLFVKRGAVPVLSRSVAAMALYTMNSYAPKGGRGHRTSLRGGGPMTTLVIAQHSVYGNTLWGRLWPNVENGERIDFNLNDSVKRIFPWLVSTRTSNLKTGGRPTTPEDVHPLQVYWGMPRRIRLNFEQAKGRTCGLTNIEDPIVVASYRTQNYGINYSEGFEHPLTPHYRKNTSVASKISVHAKPGGVNYRLWPEVVVQSKDGLREPAQVIRHWENSRAPKDISSRFVVFGYDMDNMKARAWTEGEMPLWDIDNATNALLPEYIRQTVTGASTVARLVIEATKSALYNVPKKVPGDYSFIAEIFYRDTEAAFFTTLSEAVFEIKKHLERDDPTFELRQKWAIIIEKAALRLFDECAPFEGLEERNMQRHVKSRFYLSLSLRGRGKKGKSLFEDDLGIPTPGTVRSQKSQQESK